MDKSQVIHLGGENISYAPIGIENTHIVNKVHEFSFMFFTIPILLETLLINISVVKTIKKQEKTLVNQLMMLDSTVNIVY